MLIVSIFLFLVSLSLFQYFCFQRKKLYRTAYDKIDMRAWDRAILAKNFSPIPLIAAITLFIIWSL